MQRPFPKYIVLKSNDVLGFSGFKKTGLMALSSQTEHTAESKTELRHTVSLLWAFPK